MAESSYKKIVLFLVGAENSVGFHNPTEATRVLGDPLPLQERQKGFSDRP